MISKSVKAKRRHYRTLYQVIAQIKVPPGAGCIVVPRGKFGFRSVYHYGDPKHTWKTYWQQSSNVLLSLQGRQNRKVYADFLRSLRQQFNEDYREYHLDKVLWNERIMWETE